MIWVTSDFHFNHDRLFIYGKRYFYDVQEMNEKLIQNYNEVVHADDVVYILGDLCLGGANNVEANRQLLQRLNGQLYIVRGNHDSDIRLAMYRTLDNVKAIDNAMYLKYDKFNFYLAHYPTMTTNLDFDKPIRQRLWNLAGHVHTDNKYLNMDVGCYQCEVDAHNNYPVCLDEIIEDIKSYCYNKGVI